MRRNQVLIKKIAILFSGNGTNLENLLERLHQKEVDGFKVEVVLTLTNKERAKGIERSRKYGIEPVIIDNTKFKDRESFDKELVKVIKNSGAELTILAGFMRILTPCFTSNIKAINLHPTLLPLFKGGNAINESYCSDMKVGGVTVHYVSEELDAGGIIMQRCFQKDSNMTLDSYEDTIHRLEHELLPLAVIKLLSLKGRNA